MKYIKKRVEAKLAWVLSHVLFTQLHRHTAVYIYEEFYND